MPNSYTTITLQGLGASTGINGWDQKVFGPFDFDYIATDDIKLIFKEDGDYQSIAIASVDPVTKLVTIVDNNLPFNSSPAVVSGGTAITSGTARIYRSTSLSPIVDFQSGSRISESDLDTAYRQALFASQEAVEDASASGTRTLQTSDDIVDGAISALKLASNAVENTKILNGAVTVGKLADNAVETDKIKNLNVNSDKLAADAVETDKIDDGAVTAPKLATTLDLSGKTLTFPSGGIVQGEVDTATKTEMETEASAGICVPSTLKHHPGVAAAWGVITFDDNTPALLAGYNVDSSVGEPVNDRRSITFLNDMHSVNYVVVASLESGVNQYPPFVLNKSISGFDLDANAVDTENFTMQFVVYGKLA